ncbi:MAG: aromatic ring-hydroxylating dioxygenase subunit alpha [Paracoccaceae bacterium]|nr:aromatic ring-hydroxylating dioxygenase subunit alpha [Paracoccaceae bacterium]
MGPTDLTSVLKPTGQAAGLPNAHYTCAETYAAERDRVVFDGWAALCFGHDLAEPGDANPVDFMGQPLLAVRDRDGTVRVFQNTCRHRGMILVSEKRRIGGAIRCPYHSWCYGLSGALVATPHVGGPGQNTHADIDKSSLSLVEIRSHVWRDVVFVNLSGTAPPFAEATAPLLARWAAFDVPLHTGGADCRIAFEVGCNWKLAVENYCESYHLPWVHPGLNSYSRLEDHYNIEAYGVFSGQGTRVYRQLEGDGLTFADFVGPGAEWETRAEYVALFPNLLLGVHRDHAFAIILEPKGPAATIEHLSLYYADPEAATGLRFAALREKNRALWHLVFEEDIFVVEGMQRGRAGRFFDGGRFSPVMDGPTHLFHRWVASRYAAGT